MGGGGATRGGVVGEAEGGNIQKKCRIERGKSALTTTRPRMMPPSFVAGFSVFFAGANQHGQRLAPPPTTAGGGGGGSVPSHYLAAPHSVSRTHAAAGTLLFVLPSRSRQAAPSLPGWLAAPAGRRLLLRGAAAAARLSGRAPSGLAAPVVIPRWLPAKHHYYELLPSLLPVPPLLLFLLSATPHHHRPYYRMPFNQPRACSL